MFTQMGIWKMSKNDTIFIIGSGPSLKQVDMHLLKDRDTFSMNRQYIAYKDWGFYPTYYAMIDGALLQTRWGFKRNIEPDMINNDECGIDKYFFATHHNEDGYLNKFKDRENETSVMLLIDGQATLAEDKVSFLSNGNKEFNKLVGKEVMHPKAYGNCGIFATNLSFMMGYRRIVLLGMDLKYFDWEESVAAGEDLSHFHPKYFDVDLFEECETHGPPCRDGGNTTTKPWEETTTSINKIFSEAGLTQPQIISATPDSPLNSVFEYIPFDEIVRE